MDRQTWRLDPLLVDWFELDPWELAESSGLTASLNQTLGAATAAAVATDPVSGSVSQTLGAATLASTATAPKSDASAAIALGAVDASGTAQVVLDADFAQTLGAVTAAGVATNPLDADVAQTLGDATLAATATAPLDADLAQTLGDVVAAAEATVVDGSRNADADIALGAAGLAAVATNPLDADLAVELGAATLDAATTSQDVALASADIVLGDASLDAAARVPLSAVASVSLGAASVTSTATDPINAILAWELGAVGVEGAADVPLYADADIALGEATASGFAGSPLIASADIALGEATVSAVLNAIDVAPPSPIEPYLAARPGHARQQAARAGQIVVGARRASASALSARRGGVSQLTAARADGGDVVACRPVETLLSALRKKRRTGGGQPPTRVVRTVRAGISLGAAEVAAIAELGAQTDPLSAAVSVSLADASAQGQVAVYSALDAATAIALGVAEANAQFTTGALPAARNASLNWTLDPVSLNSETLIPSGRNASVSQILGATAPTATGKVRNEAEGGILLGAVRAVAILRRPVSAVLSMALGAASAAAAGSSGGRLRGSTVLNVKDFGALGNGVRNDTLSIQAAIDALPADGGTIVVPPGTYMIDTDRLSGGGGLKLRSKMHLKLEGVLKAMNNNAARDYILLVQGVSDVEVSGTGRTNVHLLGDLDTATGLFAWPAPAGETTSEWGHGIACYGSQRVTFRDMRISKCVGDGISIGSANTADVRIERVDCYNNRRQGLSVVACVGLLVEDCTFANTKGTSPECGIDIEPENNPVRNVVIRRVRSVGNNKYGILLLRRTIEQAVIDNVLIEDCTSELNTSLGFQCKGASNVTFRRNTVQNNGSEGCWIDNAPAFRGEFNTLKNNYTKNGNNAARNFDLTGTDSRTGTDWVIRNKTADTVIGLNYYR